MRSFIYVALILLGHLHGLTYSHLSNLLKQQDMHVLMLGYSNSFGLIRKNMPNDFATSLAPFFNASVDTEPSPEPYDVILVEHLDQMTRHTDDEALEYWKKRTTGVALKAHTLTNIAPVLVDNLSYKGKFARLARLIERETGFRVSQPTFWLKDDDTADMRDTVLASMDAWAKEQPPSTSAAWISKEKSTSGGAGLRLYGHDAAIARVKAVPKVAALLQGYTNNPITMFWPEYGHRIKVDIRLYAGFTSGVVPRIVVPTDAYFRTGDRDRPYVPVKSDDSFDFGPSQADLRRTHITNNGQKIGVGKFNKSTTNEREVASAGTLGKLSQILLEHGLSPTVVMGKLQAQLAMVHAFAIHRHGCGPAGCERVVGWSTWDATIDTAGNTFLIDGHLDANLKSPMGKEMEGGYDPLITAVVHEVQYGIHMAAYVHLWDTGSFDRVKHRIRDSVQAARLPPWCSEGVQHAKLSQGGTASWADALGAAMRQFPHASKIHCMPALWETELARAVLEEAYACSFRYEPVTIRQWRTLESAYESMGRRDWLGFFELFEYVGGFRWAREVSPGCVRIRPGSTLP
jgi:hypothetical protein